MGMTILAVLGYILFSIIMLAGVISALLGLPGTAIIALDAVAYSAITGFDRIPWWVLLILVVLSIIAESTDALIAAAGAKAAGGSTQTSAAAVTGTIVGAIIGGLALTPLLSMMGMLGGPGGFLVGTIIPPLLGGLGGGYAAAYLWERKEGSEHKQAVAAGWGAMVGRMASGLVRGLISLIMVGITLYTIFATVPGA